MFLELIATIFAGIACAGVAMLLNMLTGKRLPRWITPVAAGAGMIAVTIANEYSWFSRTQERLPEGLTIAVTVEEQGWMRPWTQVWPYTKRFLAVDQATVQSNGAQRIADVYFFGRWSPVNAAPMAFDCAEPRSALLIDGAEFGEGGSLQGADWHPLPPDDPILQLACADGSG